MLLIEGIEACLPKAQYYNYLLHRNALTAAGKTGTLGNDPPETLGAYGHDAVGPPAAAAIVGLLWMAPKILSKAACIVIM